MQIQEDESESDSDSPSNKRELTVDNELLYHGRRYDTESNLYYYRARYYDPILGRFLSTDPMGYKDSMNLYQAFNMNGYNFVDPMGEETWARSIWKWLGDRVKVAKDFYSSSGSVPVNFIGTTLSDFGSVMISPLNLGTKSGEAIAEYQRNPNFENALIMSSTLWGESAEAFLLMYGGIKGTNAKLTKMKMAKVKLPGPKLPQKIADTFLDGKYVNRQLSTNEIFYKYHGINNRTGKKISWMTKKKYVNEDILRKDLAIRKDWGIDIDYVSKFDVPKGTLVSEGATAAQGAGYPGGGYQAVIQNVPLVWIQNTIRIFK